VALTPIKGKEGKRISGPAPDEPPLPKLRERGLGGEDRTILQSITLFTLVISTIPYVYYSMWES
jgi:hypothetical protein